MFDWDSMPSVGDLLMLLRSAFREFRAAWRGLDSEPVSRT